MEEKKILKNEELAAANAGEAVWFKAGSQIFATPEALESVKPLEIADLGDSSVTASRITVR